MSDVETPPEAVREEPRKLEGLGGWFILPALIVVIHIIEYGLLAAESAVGIFGAPDGTWVGNPIANGLLPSVAFVVALVALADYGIFCLVQTSQKKANAPRLLQIFFALVVLEAALNLAGLSLFGDSAEIDAGLHDAAQHVGTALTVAIIGIPYLRMSRRVKNTFVR